MCVGGGGYLLVVNVAVDAQQRAASAVVGVCGGGGGYLLVVDVAVDAR